MKPLYRKVLLRICLALLIVAPAPRDAQETTFERDEDGFVERIERNYEVKPDGSLTLDAEIGSVRVDGWTNDEVEIRIEKRVNTRREERARNAFEEIEVVLSRRDDDVHIRIVDNNESIFFRNRVTVEMTARVPERYTLDLSTVDGSIEIKNTKGPVTANAVDGNIEIGTVESQIDAGTTDGNIEIEEVTGPVIARAVDGDIEIRDTRGTVTANAVDGNIDIRHVTGEVSARTTDGDIEIRDAQSVVKVDAVDGNIETWSTEGSVDASTLEGHIGLFNAKGYVNARALRGDIDVEVARTGRDSDADNTGEPSLPPGSGSPGTDPPNADPVTRCDLDTTEGDVTLYLPDDLPATIEAEGSSGGLVLSRLWRRDIGHIYSDFGMNKSEWGVFFYIQSEAGGDINGGGDRIRLKTNSGNIYIKERHR